MVSDVHVFHASVVSVILAECDGRLVVAVKSDRIVGKVKDFVYEASDPNGFFRGVGSGHIFSFGG